MFMSSEGFQTSSVSDVPDTQGFIIRGGEEELAPGVEDQPPHPVVMPDQCERALASGSVPDADALVS